MWKRMRARQRKWMNTCQGCGWDIETEEVFGLMGLCWLCFGTNFLASETAISSAKNFWGDWWRILSFYCLASQRLFPSSGAQVPFIRGSIKIIDQKETYRKQQPPERITPQRWVLRQRRITRLRINRAWPSMLPTTFIQYRRRFCGFLGLQVWVLEAASKWTVHREERNLLGWVGCSQSSSKDARFEWNYTYELILYSRYTAKPQTGPIRRWESALY